VEDAVAGAAPKGEPGAAWVVVEPKGEEVVGAELAGVIRVPGVCVGVKKGFWGNIGFVATTSKIMQIVR
jgi:hypothetical protein